MNASRQIRVWVCLAALLSIPVAICGQATRPSSLLATDGEVEPLRALKTSLEKCDGCREGTVQALRDFVRAGGSERRETLQLLVTSSDEDTRCLGRFALAADEGRAGEVYRGLIASDDPGVRLQAELAVIGLPVPAEKAALSRAVTDSYVARAREVSERGFIEGDRFVAREIRLGDEGSAVALTHYFHGAYGQHATLFFFSGERRLPLDMLTVSDGSFRWIEFEGRMSLLASEIYCEGACGRSEAWVGVVAVRHRLFSWSGARFVERDCFFTAFRGQYP